MKLSDGSITLLHEGGLGTRGSPYRAMNSTEIKRKVTSVHQN